MLQTSLMTNDRLPRLLPPISPMIVVPQSEAFSPQSPLRSAITAAYRQDEAQNVGALMTRIHWPLSRRYQSQTLARKLVESVREKRTRASGVDALMHEFSLSSEEGVALMCLAEALLRIPDHKPRTA